MDNPDAGRFELEVDGQLAQLSYRRVGQRLVLVHTEVPPALEGRGIGGRLVRSALESARRDGATIVPLCPFARRWLEQHRDEVDGVDIDWSQPPSS